MLYSTRILLVEDCASLRQFLVDFLAYRGYQVSAVPYSEAALAVLNTTRVDLLLTDLNLPGMCGDELIRQVRQRYPLLRTVLMSSDPDVARVAVACGADRALHKDSLLHDLTGLLATLVPVIASPHADMLAAQQRTQMPAP